MLCWFLITVSRARDFSKCAVSQIVECAAFVSSLRVFKVLSQRNSNYNVDCLLTGTALALGHRRATDGAALPCEIACVDIAHNDEYEVQ